VAVATRVFASRGALFQGDSDFIVARGADGDLGVLPGHAPLLTWLKPGEVMVRVGEKEEYFFLADAFLEVLPDRVSILAEVGEKSADLDPREAEEARKAAEETLARAPQAEEAELSRLRQNLEVATARLEAAERQRHRGRD
jgi:F-type H+-transporting ATPase subunit epsilon